jgi:AcrR family transcriptional regulator
VPSAPVIGPEPRLRADAQRNLDRILVAAREVVSEQGVDAPMVEIARRAGVGQGTLYRRFPTRQELLLTMLERRLVELAEDAEAAVADEDAWGALVGILERVATARHLDRSLTEALERHVLTSPRLTARRTRVLDALGALLRRAQLAGVARDDLEPEDLPFLIMAVGQSTCLPVSGPPELWRRYLAVILDGMRAPGTRPLPVRAPSRAELEEGAGRGCGSR